MDLFSYLGIKNEVKKDDSKKATSKKNEEVVNKNSTLDKDVFSITGNDITIITGFYDPIIIKHNQSNLITIKDIYSNLKDYPEYTEITSKLKQLKDNVFLLYFSKDAVVNTFTIVLADNWRVILGGIVLELSTMYSESIVSLEEISSCWENIYPEYAGANYIVDDSEHIIIPIITQECSSVVVPSSFSIFGQSTYTIDESDLITYNIDGTNFINVDDDLDDSESDYMIEYDNTYEISLSIEQTINLLSQKYTELQVYDSNFIVSSFNDYYLLVPSVKSVSKAIKDEKKQKKEITYPTMCTTLSLAFTRFELSPDLFDGKQEVTSKELVKYIQNQGYPEYNDTRTNFDYDKSNKIIIAYLTGSKKGNCNTNPLININKLSNGIMVREESTNIGYFMATDSKENGEFQFYLPKISSNIFSEIHEYFYEVNQWGIRNGYGLLEAACQIFYDFKVNRYFVYYPEQTVDGLSVDVVRNRHLETNKNMVLVMDIHSHHTMAPVFSAMDDEDEKGTRLFAVMGNLSKENYKLNLRAGTGGYFIQLKFEDIIEHDNSVRKSLYINWNNITYRYSEKKAM